MLSFSKDPKVKENKGFLGLIGPHSPYQALYDKLIDKEIHHIDIVHTDYGWHIIQLMDKQKFDPPSIDLIEPQLQAMIREKWLTHLYEKLKKDHQIIYYAYQEKE